MVFPSFDLLLETFSSPIRGFRIYFHLSLHSTEIIATYKSQTHYLEHDEPTSLWSRNKHSKQDKQQKKETQSAAAANAHSSQLAAWRNGDSKSLDMATLAAMRRASKSAQWLKKYPHDGRDKTGNSFADKRRQQLNKWRVTRVNTNEG